MTITFEKRELVEGRISGVDFAKILGAIMIVVFHFGCHCEALTPYITSTANFDYGSLVVGLFFAVSGACLSRTYLNIDIKSYAIRRWKAIFPMYLTAYIIYGMIHALTVGAWWTAYPPFYFIFTLIGMDGYFCYTLPTPYLLGEWFIGAIILCYIAFPILKKALEYIPHITLLLLWIGSYFIPYIGNPEMYAFRNPWVCITLFYTGMYISQYPKLLTNRISLIVSLVLFSILSIVPLTEYLQCLRVINYMIPGILLFIISIQLGDIINKLFNNPPVVNWLGKVSFPIFLVQHVIIYSILAHWNSPMPLENIAPLLWTIILSIAFAWLLSVIVDRIMSIKLKQ